MTQQSREAYLAWMDEWAAAVNRVLSEDGSLFLNVGSKPSDPLVPFQLLEVMLRRFKLQNVIHWVKSIAIMKSEVGNYPGITQDVVVGHYKPISSERFLNDCQEYIFHLTKHGRRAAGQARSRRAVSGQDERRALGERRKDLHCRGNTWFIPYETIQSSDKERPHPATFPVELPSRCIRLHGLDRARLVMDPFLGIGSSAIACARLGAPFVGFEIAPDYYQESCERLKLELGPRLPL